jgi:hypothetical protein
MLATSTFRRSALKWGLTFVAEPAAQLFRGGPMANRQRCNDGRMRPGISLIHHHGWIPHHSFGWGLLGPLGWVPRAFLTTGVLAALTHLIGAERDVTTMACPMHPHAYDLFHSLNVPAGGEYPIARFQLEPILDKQHPSFLFLNGMATRSCFRQPLTVLLERRLRVLDGLLKGSRDRGDGRSLGFGQCCLESGKGSAVIG